MPPVLLNDADFATVVRLAPLVSIDLIIRNAQDQVLLGLRNNEPAKGFFFVPGGAILKNERLHEAFARILERETGYAAAFADARLIVVFEHFYANNRFGEAGYGTHYIALGYALKLAATSDLKIDAQHAELRWWDEAELLASQRVHHNTKAYLR